jgi:hypothetical protein
MNNFSQLLATEIWLPVNIELDVRVDNGEPWTRVAVSGDVLYDDWIQGPLELSTRVHIDQPVVVEISMRHKIYHSDRETAILLRRVEVDGIDVLSEFSHLSVYEHEHGGEPGPTTYLGVNGDWRLEITPCFYQWLHRCQGQGWLLTPVRAKIPGSVPN